jgi:hypothetical protein
MYAASSSGSQTRPLDPSRARGIWEVGRVRRAAGAELFID